MLAGAAYPAAMTWLGIELTQTDVLRFVASLTLCGLIAAAYPFLGISAIALDVFFPRLLKAGPPSQQDVAALAWLHQWTGRYLVLAISLPLLAVAILAVTGEQNDATTMALLSVGGFLALWPAFRVARRIQRDAATLANFIETSTGDPADTTVPTASVRFKDI